MALDNTKKKKIVAEFGSSTQDTGSTRVQIALLSANIDELKNHCEANPNDFSCKRGLLKAVAQRRDLLAYLQKINEEQYRQTIEQLGLRK